MLEGVRRALAGAAMTLATILFIGPAVAQSAQDWKCTAKTEIPPDDRISSCTTVIESGNYGSRGAISAYFNRGNTYFYKGEFDRAIADFTQVIQLYPKNMYAYRARAAAYYKHGDLERAIADYTQEIELNPNDEYAYAYRGVAYEAAGDLDHGIADYTRAIQLDPKYKAAYCARGSAYRAKGDLDRAISDFTQVIQLDPKYKAAYSVRGSAYKAASDFDRAIADYDRAIELDPKDARAYLVRGIAHLHAGSLPKALADLNQSSELDPKDAYTALWLEIVGKLNSLGSRLAETTTQLDLTKWPAPVIRLFLGQMTPEAVLAAADDPDPKRKKGQICEANFFTGELALQRGTKDDAVRLFRIAVADCPKTFTEWSAAKAELRTLGANP